MTTSLNDPTERLAMPRPISAATARRRLGYDRVHHLAGGYAAWYHRGTTG
jgi:rhodanese-related sulfurtransferase